MTFFLVEHSGKDWQGRVLNKRGIELFRQKKKLNLKFILLVSFGSSSGGPLTSSKTSYLLKLPVLSFLTLNPCKKRQS